MKRAFELIREVKSVTIATSTNNIPHSRIIDIMNYDESGIYFTTSGNKPFYKQLKENNNVAVTAMTENYIQIRIVGKVEELSGKTSDEAFDDICKNNPEFVKLFQNKISTFRVFYLSDGHGEIFDLSGEKEKLIRERFSFGSGTVKPSGCYINDSCISCGKCAKICPFLAITDDHGFKINPSKCDECGLCISVCPVNAIEPPKGL